MNSNEVGRAMMGAWIGRCNKGQVWLVALALLIGLGKHRGRHEKSPFPHLNKRLSNFSWRL